ncbi:unnamed protein product [Scytosiphon promiscuus]
MPAILAQQKRWPRGPANELHIAARDGDDESAARLLSAGWINVNQGDPGGWTPLMIACLNGQTAVVRVLLGRGADTSIVREHSGFTALLFAAHHGFLEITKMLLAAGADADYAAPHGSTSLHLAAEKGHRKVIRCLIGAGAKVDPRMLEGETPLYHAAFDGRLGAVRELLRWGADPLITRTNESGHTFVPLDMAAQNGHLPIVRELLGELGLEGCGGERRGSDALRQAAKNQHLEILALLAGAGVVDTAGDALIMAVACGRDRSVDFLLRQHRELRRRPLSAWCTSSEGRLPVVYSPLYVDRAHDLSGSSAVLHALGASGHCSPRILRMLIDAGADATSLQGSCCKEMPLPMVERSLCTRTVAGSPATSKQLRALEAARRLLICVAAAQAVSWEWPAPSGGEGGSLTTAEGGHETAVVVATVDEVTSPNTALSLIPAAAAAARGARRSRLFLTALHRYSVKPRRGSVKFGELEF